MPDSFLYVIGYERYGNTSIGEMQQPIACELLARCSLLADLHLLQTFLIAHVVGI